MGVPISNVTRRVVFAPSGTGPYAFTFEILAATDIEVYKGDTLLTLTTDYTVTINTNGTGSVTLVATAGTDNITIIGARAIERTTDFVTGGDFFANTVNTEFDSLTIFAQQNAEGIERALRAPETDPTTINMTLPRAADRANKYLAFDANGDPAPGDTAQEIADVAANIANINIVKGQITPVNNIATVAGISANITTVAGISGNVTTVAGISGNVTTVAGISADVTAVAGDATDIGTVAGLSTEIAALGPIAADITTVAGIDSDVTAVAADATDIGTVASNIANVNTVAGISADVTTVAADGTDIGTVAGISGDVTTVAGIAANVTTVAGISANVTTVAGISADVTTVAGDSADIQLLAANITTIASKANAGANSDITSLTGLGAGINSAPTIAPTGDTNTGIYFPAADTIGFAAGGVEAARLVSGLLSVPANSSAASAIRLYEDSDNGTNYVDLIAPDSVASNRTLTMPDASGTIDRLNRAGNVLQVVQNSSEVTTTSTTSTSYVDLTNATATITPSSTANKVLVLWTSWGSNSLVAATNAQYLQRVLRTSTELAQTSLSAESGAGGLQAKGAMAFSILDDPNTTSAVTYKIQHRVNNASSTGTANNGFLTLMEIAA